MAVTKTTVNVAGSFSAAQLATGFAQALTDAGLLTSSTWYDSFLSGTIENRILEVQHDNTKTYGKTYYWFMFTTTDIYVHNCSGWNATTHVPTGTQYLDYYNTVTNATTSQRNLLTLANATNVTFTTYKSGTCGWILLRNGTASFLFNIFPAGITFQPWVDLNKVYVTGLSSPKFTAVGAYGYIEFWGYTGYTRRTLNLGAGSYGTTSAASYNFYQENYSGWVFPGAITNSTNYPFNQGSFNSSYGVIVPLGITANNPAYTTNFYPIINNLPYAAWSTSNMGVDFAVFSDYANNTYSLQDTVVVSSGVEEWEVMGFANSTAANAGRPSPLFMARVI